MTTLCESCDGPLLAGDLFCATCGEKVERDSETTRAATINRTPPSDSPSGAPLASPPDVGLSDSPGPTAAVVEREFVDVAGNSEVAAPGKSDAPAPESAASAMDAADSAAHQLSSDGLRNRLDEALQEFAAGNLSAAMLGRVEAELLRQVEQGKSEPGHLTQNGSDQPDGALENSSRQSRETEQSSDPQHHREDGAERQRPADDASGSAKPGDGEISYTISAWTPDALSRVEAGLRGRGISHRVKGDQLTVTQALAIDVNAVVQGAAQGTAPLTEAEPVSSSGQEHGDARTGQVTGQSANRVSFGWASVSATKMLIGGALIVGVILWAVMAFTGKSDAEKWLDDVYGNSSIGCEFGARAAAGLDWYPGIGFSLHELESAWRKRC